MCSVCFLSACVSFFMVRMQRSWNILPHYNRAATAASAAIFMWRGCPRTRSRTCGACKQTKYSLAHRTTGQTTQPNPTHQHRPDGDGKKSDTFQRIVSTNVQFPSTRMEARKTARSTQSPWCTCNSNILSVDCNKNGTRFCCFFFFYLGFWGWFTRQWGDCKVDDLW